MRQAVRMTLTALPTKTATKAATSTPTASATTTPTATATPQPTIAWPTWTPTPTISPTPTGNPLDGLVVTLLQPLDDTLVTDSTQFAWQSNLPLPEGYLFEPAFWQDNGDPLVLGRGWGGSTRDYAMSLRPKDFIPGDGSYYWTVRIIDVTGRPVRIVAPTLNIRVESPGSPPANSGGNPQPAPQPTSTPARPR